MIGGALLALCLMAVYSQLPTPGESEAATLTSPLKSWLSKPGSWKTSPVESLFPEGKPSRLLGILGVFLVAAACFGHVAKAIEGQGQGGKFLLAFPIIFLLALLAFILAAQEVVKYYSLSYALWALVAGLLISNTIGTPAFLKPAVRTELYIKTGLVVLGAEVLFSKLLALGVPGIFVAWVVTPTVLISTFWFGQKILKISSPSLNMVISADMSVCGVSAAIATAAACKAKKEELTAAIGLSLIFTVVMMVVMPAVIKATGMGPVLGGAWMGGTIDSTGAVGAAGAILGDEALTVATTVKMIQNVLIGVVAFAVAVYWVRYQTPATDGVQPSLSEIWNRFPKFVLGFLAASLAFSAVYSFHPAGEQLIGAMISGSTKTLRGWFFCLAFVSIGLDTNFKELSRQFRGGKPLVLYAVGQTLNLCLTLFMAWLMFEKVFPSAADVLMAK
ncbi:MAG: putative sulfate exporter family transporter [Planctomycetes bacterium]|nr:putative sulfate exporter family transporter [Planctomycetota bacterium]